MHFSNYVQVSLRGTDKDISCKSCKIRILHFEHLDSGHLDILKIRLEKIEIPLNTPPHQPKGPAQGPGPLPGPGPWGGWGGVFRGISHFSKCV